MSSAIFSATSRTRNVKHGKPLKDADACEELGLNHDKSSWYRPETNVIAEGAVRRVKKGTFTLTVQAGFGHGSWRDAVGDSARYSMVH